MSETKGTYYTPADADAIANAMAYQPDGVLSLHSLRSMVRTLTTQLNNERKARVAAESGLTAELEGLREELGTQKRMIAQLMRERVA